MFEDFRQQLLGGIFRGALDAAGRSGGFQSAVEKPSSRSQVVAPSAPRMSPAVGMARSAVQQQPRQQPRQQPQQQVQQPQINPMVRDMFMRAILSGAQNRMQPQQRRVLGASAQAPQNVGGDIEKLMQRNKTASDAFRRKPEPQPEEQRGFLQFIKALFGIK